MVDLDEFSAWLTDQGLRPNTVDTYVRSARQILEWTEEGQTLPDRPGLQMAAKHLVEFIGEFAEWPSVDLQEACAQLLHIGETAVQKRRRKQKKQKKKSRSIPDKEWYRLLEHVEEDDAAEAVVLEVMMWTALRIGDVLAIPASRLRSGLKSGELVLEVKGGDDRVLVLEPVERSWWRLLTLMEDENARNVALAVAPNGDGSPKAGDAAYKAVARYLQESAELLELSGRVHLHRLRRTVLVQTLNLTGDLQAVQQLGGHASQKTTMEYTSEARPHAVSATQQKLVQRRQRFEGDSE